VNEAGSDTASRVTLPHAALVAHDVHVRYRTHSRGGSVADALTRRRRPHREVHAVRGVDITVHEGEALGVIGRNGSGKSSLLRTLAGLVPPSSGRVLAKAEPVLLGVSAVLQRELSCRRNIVLGATALGITRREAVSRTDEVLAFAGLQDRADLPFRTLSSGMRARLQFAIATAVEPAILMIDELLGVGDAEFRRKSEDRMQRLLHNSGTVVLVSHSMGFIASNCTRVIWMDRGLIAQDGDPAAVIAAYNNATS
jgi:teichoic acid transport system ATP-binding protein